MKAAPGSQQMRVLRALCRNVCKTPEILAAEIGMGRKDVVRFTGDLISRGLADRREVGCYVLSAAGYDFLAAGRKITGGPTGPLTQATPRRWKKTTVQEKAWRAMRIAKKFTLSDLIGCIAGQGDDLDKIRKNVGRFVTRLAKAGLLHELRRERGAVLTSNGFKRWTLLQDTGPLAPVYVDKRGEIHDPNTGLNHSLDKGLGNAKR